MPCRLVGATGWWWRLGRVAGFRLPPAPARRSAARAPTRRASADAEASTCDRPAARCRAWCWHSRCRSARHCYCPAGASRPCDFGRLGRRRRRVALHPGSAAGRSPGRCHCALRRPSRPCDFGGSFDAARRGCSAGSPPLGARLAIAAAPPPTSRPCDLSCEGSVGVVPGAGGVLGAAGIVLVIAGTVFGAAGTVLAVALPAPFTVPLRSSAPGCAESRVALAVPEAAPDAFAEVAAAAPLTWPSDVPSAIDRTGGFGRGIRRCALGDTRGIGHLALGVARRIGHFALRVARRVGRRSLRVVLGVARFALALSAMSRVRPTAPSVPCLMRPPTPSVPRPMRPAASVSNVPPSVPLPIARPEPVTPPRPPPRVPPNAPVALPPSTGSTPAPHRSALRPRRHA